MIPIFFLWNGGKSKLGGTATFTAHLVKAFRQMGYDAKLFRVGMSDEEFERPFKLGINSIMVSQATARALPGPRIIACQASHQAELFDAICQPGDTVVLHDRKQLSYTFSKVIEENKPKIIVIRECNTDIIEGSVFIPHPYVREGSDRKPDFHAVSLARISAVKNTEIIIEANAKLPPERRVRMYGSISNEMVTYHSLDDRYTELWRDNYHGPFPIAVNPCVIASQGYYNVDLTVMDGDGQGGSQYTFLEAFDVGATLIVHRAWCKPNSCVSEGETCLAVESVEELVKILQEPVPSIPMFNNEWILKQYSPEQVIPEYLKLMRSE